MIIKTGACVSSFHTFICALENATLLTTMKTVTTTTTTATSTAFKAYLTSMYTVTTKYIVHIICNKLKIIFNCTSRNSVCVFTNGINLEWIQFNLCQPKHH